MIWSVKNVEACRWSEKDMKAQGHVFNRLPNSLRENVLWKEKLQGLCGRQHPKAYGGCFPMAMAEMVKYERNFENVNGNMHNMSLLSYCH